MTLRLINHASCLIESGQVSLLSDPWYSGSAFNDGWDLLINHSLSESELRGVTHIWLSHEHPDHFSIPFFKSFPSDQRAKTTILYQMTRDRKVVTFLKSLGFATRELPELEPCSLGEDFEIRIGKVPFYDSWLSVRTGGKTILNLNDCDAHLHGGLERIAKEVGQPDVLLTQFSYARGFGNKTDTEIRKQKGQLQLDRIAEQIRVLSPKQVTPFASLIYFSHAENVHLNDGANTVRESARTIEAAGSKPLILYPGEEWSPDKPGRENEASLQKYDLAFQGRASKPLRTSPACELGELQSLTTSYIARMRSGGAGIWISLASLLPIGFFRPVRIFLTDLKKVMELSWRSGLRTVADTEASVSMSSQSLAFLLKFDYGFDTLIVNGRFEATQEGLQRLSCSLFLGSLRNMGKTFGPSLAFDRTFQKRALAFLFNNRGSRPRLREARPALKGA